MDDRRTSADRRDEPRGGRRSGDLERLAVCRVRAVMEARGLTVTAVSGLCGIPYRTMWGFLNGTDFRITTLDAIATGLQIPPEDFLRAA